jgi:hypothetical protein
LSNNPYGINVPAGFDPGGVGFNSLSTSSINPSTVYNSELMFDADLNIGADSFVNPIP